MAKAIILLYHHVAEVDIDPWALCVTPGHFAEHLEVLQKYRCIQLKELARIQHDGKNPGCSVVVTFDDGYADNLHSAKPLLERYGIGATFFLITGYIGRKNEIWCDELERFLLRPGTLPRGLHINVNGSTHQWELGEAAHYCEEEYRQDSRRRAWEGKPGSRLFLYHSIWQLLRPLQEEERRGVMKEIMLWAGAEPIVRRTHRPLLREEVRSLEEGRLVEVGGHTVTHPLLSAQPIAFQQEEIWQSKAYLEDLLGHRVTSFSYPYGDYTMETVPLIREAGFNCACTTVADVVNDHTDLFQLPRFGVGNWDGEEFSKQMSIWLGDSGGI